MTTNKDTPIIIESPVIVLIGPTAIGKTALSLELADRFNCEIVSVDSMQVYRYMDIGTAKPSPAEQGRAVHHLIDIVDPDQPFDAARFVRHALAAIDSITAAGRIPLLTGGTGMYLKALFHGLFDFDTAAHKTVRQDLARLLADKGNQQLYDQLRQVDPETASRIHPNDVQRLLRALEIYLVSGRPWSDHLEDQPPPPVHFRNIRQFGLHCERQLLYERIGKRSKLMVEAGLIAEVEGLRKMGYGSQLPSMQSIGYRHANNYLDGIWDMEETMRLLVRDTRRYAKRQMTWFNSDPAIQWIDRGKGDEIVKQIDTWLNG
ncbi:MAG: tRNA (adenosine(37)-N6)-dimethylallyltransferase MiaA [Desulfobulbaceae bacterium]|nr:tRNA (adenosine(37)-N6)-dimethylallyltransferase MiaA [Desulfobulbaceae bacterium]